MTYEVTVGERSIQVSVESTDAGYRLCLDGGDPVEVDARRLGDVLSLLLDDGRSFDAGLVSRGEGRWLVDLLGVQHELTVLDPRRKALRLAGGAGEGTLASSMPGRVVALLVDEGQAVTQGEPVLVLEAMKMENEVKAPIDGTIAKVFVSAGQSVDAGEKLVLIEAAE